MFFFLFIQLCGSKAIAQSLKSYDKVEIQTLYINSKDSMVRFQVLSDSKKEKYLPEFTYWWYKSNAILKTTGGADGKLLNGDYVCFYPDNNLKEKGTFLKGVKDKLWITWFPNGKMQEQFTWKKGVLHGAHIAYSIDGKINSNEKYVNGVVKKKKERAPRAKSKNVSDKPVPLKKEIAKEIKPVVSKKTVAGKKTERKGQSAPVKKDLKQSGTSDNKKK